MSYSCTQDLYFISTVSGKTGQQLHKLDTAQCEIVLEAEV